jgi:hypothetical protein
MNDLTLEEILNEALLDEYRARDTYRKIIDTFGAVRPFINIVEAEQRHIESLLTLYEKYDVPLPAIPHPEQIEVPDTLVKACQMGVVAEIENLTLYDRLIESTDLPDVVEILQRLQAASRDKHLPAFQRCVEQYGATGQEPGSGRRRGGAFRGPRGHGTGPGGPGRPRQ